jgi:hypothetical protein
LDGHTNVVQSVYWRVNGTDGTHNSTAYGVARISFDPGVPFTDYANLTADQVIGWAKDFLGSTQVSNIEAGLEDAIARQINPPVISPALPWVPVQN